MPPTFQAPSGTLDVLPQEAARYAEVISRFATRAARAGFGLIIGPMFEDLGVFQRIGASTDVVRKEMYDFQDKGGRHLALKPDGTAPVARAYIEHRPPTPWKVWYATPKFRYERPQAGRYRQHHEVGAEVIGTDDPDVDVEVIDLLHGLYRELGLKEVRLRITSLGDAVCRPAYRDRLIGFLEERRDQLCAEHRDRIHDNPLRVLDCKRDACVAATAESPKMLEWLCDECTAHFARVREGLDALGLDYEVDDRLVRGLDYYTRTTFEFTADAITSAQNGIGGGGRYDRLIEELGGPPTPGIGFGSGIERILIACDFEGIFPAPERGVEIDVFVVDFTGGAAARDLVHELREVGFRADRAYDSRSAKAQFKAADRAGARVALVVGPDELEAGKVTVRDLAQGEQELVDRAKVVAHLRDQLTP